MSVRILDVPNLRPLDAYERLWLSSESLFEAYRQDFPRYADQLGPQLFVADQGPRDRIWCYRDSEAVIVGVDINTSRSEQQRQLLQRCAEAYLKALKEQSSDIQLGARKQVVLEDPAGLPPVSVYAAFKPCNGSLRVAWAATGDWCRPELALFERWGDDPMFINAPLPEIFHSVAVLVEPRQFALAAAHIPDFLAFGEPDCYQIAYLERYCPLRQGVDEALFGSHQELRQGLLEQAGDALFIPQLAVNSYDVELGPEAGDLEELFDL